MDKTGQGWTFERQRLDKNGWVEFLQENRQHTQDWTTIGYSRAKEQTGTEKIGRQRGTAWTRLDKRRKQAMKCQKYSCMRPERKRVNIDEDFPQDMSYVPAGSLRALWRTSRDTTAGK